MSEEQVEFLLPLTVVNHHQLLQPKYKVTFKRVKIAQDKFTKYLIWFNSCGIPLGFSGVNVIEDFKELLTEIFTECKNSVPQSHLQIINQVENILHQSVNGNWFTKLNFDPRLDFTVENFAKLLTYNITINAPIDLTVNKYIEYLPYISDSHLAFTNLQHTLIMLIYYLFIQHCELADAVETLDDHMFVEQRQLFLDHALISLLINWVFDRTNTKMWLMNSENKAISSVKKELYINCPEYKTLINSQTMPTAQIQSKITQYIEERPNLYAMNLMPWIFYDGLSQKNRIIALIDMFKLNLTQFNKNKELDSLIDLSKLSGENLYTTLVDELTNIKLTDPDNFGLYSQSVLSRFSTTIINFNEIANSNLLDKLNTS